MFWQQILQIAFSFIAVIALILILSWIVRKLGLHNKLQLSSSSHGLIKVIDSLFIDHKRRIVLLQFEKTRYMLLLDGEKSQLIDKIAQENE
jgi:flagellar biogenesis protein FliO